MNEVEIKKIPMGVRTIPEEAWKPKKKRAKGQYLSALEMAGLAGADGAAPSRFTAPNTRKWRR